MKTKLYFLTVLFVLTFLATELIAQDADNQAARRQSIANLNAHLLFNAGIPFVKGDTITLPVGSVMAIDRETVGKKILYYVKLSTSLDGAVFCIIISRPLKLLDAGNGFVVFESLRIKYKQVVQYQQGAQVYNSFAFEVVE